MTRGEKLMNEILKLNAFSSSKIDMFMNLDSKEKIIKQRFVGVHNLEINKYISRNVTVIEGITGSGKTYYVENLFNFDTTKKLLLSSKAVAEKEESELIKELNERVGFVVPMSYDTPIDKEEFDFIINNYGSLFENDNSLQTLGIGWHEL